MYVEREVVVEIGKGNAVLRSHRLPDDDLVDVIEFIPVFITTNTHTHTHTHTHTQSQWQ